MRRPPGSTRTDAFVPNSTLFRSHLELLPGIATQPAAGRLVGQEPLYGVAQRRRRRRAKKPGAAIFDDLSHAGNVGADDGGAAGHRLQQGLGVPLVAGSQNEDPHPVDHLRPVLTRTVAMSPRLPTPAGGVTLGDRTRIARSPTPP